MAYRRSQKSLVVSIAVFASLLASATGCRSTSQSASGDAAASMAEQESLSAGSMPHGADILPAQATVYFDFDMYNVRPDQQGTVSAVAAALKQAPSFNVRIEGHTDDRGSVEYNLALGMRRAESLKQALVTMGADANSIATVSYGKERPVTTAQDESAWAENRRAVVTPAQ